MGTSVAVRDMDLGDKSWFKREAGQTGVSDVGGGLHLLLSTMAKRSCARLRPARERESWRISRQHGSGSSTAPARSSRPSVSFRLANGSTAASYNPTTQSGTSHAAGLNPSHTGCGPADATSVEGSLRRYPMTSDVSRAVPARAPQAALQSKAGQVCGTPGVKDVAKCPATTLQENGGLKRTSL